MVMHIPAAISHSFEGNEWAFRWFRGCHMRIHFQRNCGTICKGTPEIGGRACCRQAKKGREQLAHALQHWILHVLHVHCGHEGDAILVMALGWVGRQGAPERFSQLCAWKAEIVVVCHRSDLCFQHYRKIVLCPPTEAAKQACRACQVAYTSGCYHSINSTVQYTCTRTTHASSRRDLCRCIQFFRHADSGLQGHRKMCCAISCPMGAEASMAATNTDARLCSLEHLPSSPG